MGGSFDSLGRLGMVGPVDQVGMLADMARPAVQVEQKMFHPELG